MDIDSPSSSSSSSSPYSDESFSENPDVNGFLYLYGNPGPWIENHPIASHLLLQHLLLDFSYTEEYDQEEIDDSIENLTRLTQLTICGAKSLKCLPVSIAKLQSLRHLTFRFCDFKELPAHIGLLKMNLTHLTLYGCYYIKSLPETVASLSNLTCLDIGRCFYLTGLPPCLGKLRSLTELTLQGCYVGFLTQCIATLTNLTSFRLSDCEYITELPACFVQLRSLQRISLENCFGLKSLPNAMSNLLELETLYIKKCPYLTELPANLKVTYLKLIDSSISFIPGCLFNLRHLEITYVVELESLRNLFNLQSLTIDFRRCIPYLAAAFYQLVNLEILCLRGLDDKYFVNISDYMEGLGELILLDIQDTEVKYLPWSIMKLPKLRFLMLPQFFRLQTLPFHLNDSVIVSVKGRYVHKPWKQLKQEIGVLPFPFVQGGYPSTIAPPGYLSLQGDPGQWIRGNYRSRSLVKMLGLTFSGRDDVEGARSSIGKLPNITHLFVSKDCIPHSAKGLKHLCIYSWRIESLSANLGRLSNLETLELTDTTCLKSTNLPISLRILILRCGIKPCSIPANIAKLFYLHTLDLTGSPNVTSLPLLNIVTLRISQIIKSLPIGMRNLEILHVKRNCVDKSCDKHSNMLKHCLTKLVRLETFSLTCYDIKSLPSMAGQHSLQVLTLRDCFALKELRTDIERLVKLKTLDISGTRIKYLPDSIINIPKLQQIILPRGFTQKLPRKLKELSIIDDTDERYYKHTGFYDSDFETSSDSSCEGNDDNQVGHPIIQGVTDEQACEQNDVYTQVPRVSRFTVKRISYEHGITPPSCKRSKWCPDTKEEEEPNTDTTCLNKPSKPADGNGQACVKKSHVEVPQHVGEHIAQPDNCSSSFDFVKACYEGDIVWIAFSLTSSFDQLHEFVRKKFGLEVEKIKIKYLDEDKEWLLMTCVSDLTHALLHTSSSGSKFVRLSVTLMGVVNTGQASETNHEHIIPKKSEGGSVWMSIHSDKERLKYKQCARENTNQPLNRNCIPFFEFCLPHIRPFIEGLMDVKLDGNCGFRVIATFEYGDEERWLDVRIDLSKELNSNMELYKKALGGDEEFDRANSIVNWLISPANKMHWFEVTCLGLVVATKYQKVFTCWSTECCTYLPLESRLVDHKPPNMYINMARINGNHFIALQMPTSSPLPPLSPLWKWHCHESVKHWSTSTFKEQLDAYL